MRADPASPKETSLEPFLPPHSEDQSFDDFDDDFDPEDFDDAALGDDTPPAADRDWSPLSDDDLVAALFTAEDTLPRSFVTEVLARRDRLTNALIAVAMSRRRTDDRDEQRRSSRSAPSPG